MADFVWSKVVVDTGDSPQLAFCNLPIISPVAAFDAAGFRDGC